MNAQLDGFDAALARASQRRRRSRSRRPSATTGRPRAQVGRDVTRTLWEEPAASNDNCDAHLADAGYDDPDALVATLARVRNSGRYRELPAASRQRFDTLVPQLLAVAVRASRAVGRAGRVRAAPRAARNGRAAQRLPRARHRASAAPAAHRQPHERVGVGRRLPHAPSAAARRAARCARRCWRSPTGTPGAASSRASSRSGPTMPSTRWTCCATSARADVPPAGAGPVRPPDGRAPRRSPVGARRHRARRRAGARAGAHMSGAARRRRASRSSATASWAARNWATRPISTSCSCSTSPPTIPTRTRAKFAYTRLAQRLNTWLTSTTAAGPALRHRLAPAARRRERPAGVEPARLQYATSASTRGCGSTRR